MIRHSSKRGLTTLLGQLLVPTTLAISLCVAPSVLPAQQNSSKTSQAESAKNGREKAEEFLKQSRKELDKKQFAASRELLEKARAADPKVAGLDQLAKDIAAAEAKSAAGNKQKQVDDLIKAARTLTKSGKYEEASAQVAKALALDPANADAKKLQADIREEQTAGKAGKIKEVVNARIKAADKAIKENNFEQARRTEASAREASGGLYKKELDALSARIAQSEAKFSAKKNEAEIKRLLETANAQLKANQFDSSRQSLSKIFQLDKQNKKANALLSKVGEQEKKFLASTADRKAVAELEAADRLLKAKKYDEAVKAYEALAIKRPNDSVVKSKLAEARSQLAKASAPKKEVASAAKKEAEAKKPAVEAAKKDASAEAAKKEADAKKAKEAAEKKLADEKKAAEARKSEAESAAKAEAAKKEADARKAKEAAEKKLADEKKAAETKKAEAESAAKAEAAKKEADAKKAKEEAEKKLADEKKAAEVKKTEATSAVSAEAAKKEADAKKAKEEAEKKLADEKKAAEARKAEAESAAKAEAAKAEAAKKEADAKKAKEAAEKKLADEKKAAEAKKEADAKKAKEAAEKKAADEKKANAESTVKAEAAKKEAEAKKAADSGKKSATMESPFAEPGETTKPAEKPAPAATKAKESEPKKATAEKAADAATKSVEEAASKNREAAEEAYEDGIKLYNKGELAQARQRWLDAKELDPTFTKPDTYLANTEAEFNAFLANQAQKSEFEQKEADAQEKLNTLIPLRTLEPTNLSDFLQSLRLLSGIDFVIAGEVNAKVEAAFEDEPLHRVLDTVLLPIGLRWDRKPGTSTIVITPDLRTEVFTVLPDQLNTVDVLIKDGVVPRLLYGPTGQATLAGQEIYVDQRKNIVVMTDSEANLEKFRRFLDGLKGTTGTQLIIDSYEIDQSKAPEIKALLGAILAGDDKQPFNPERKLILEGGTLIIKDSPENIAKVRQILQDQNFLKKFYSDELSIGTYNLTPVVTFGEENPDLVRSFADQVRQVVETLLYAKEGRSKAEREGRRLWYDPATLQLTITDYPDRLQAVQDFIESLPQIQSRRRNKIYFLDWANAGDMVGQIEQFLGITAQSTTSEATGNAVTKNLRVEDELSFNGAFFRVTRVNENDVNDENDDSVELVVRTNTTSQDTTIEEFRSEFVEDFQIVAEDIKPSNTAGEGRARLTITYSPGGQSGLQSQEGTGTSPTDETAEQQREEVRAETGLSLVDIENLNAIYVEYDNVEELRRVEFWIKTLDIPTLQVSIEVKFVEVITNKAKQLKPDFSIGDLSEGVTLSDSVLRSRFAQDRDEFDSVFDPALESSDSANLLKGATVFNYIVSNGNSPISLTLRAYEAQGVINVVNGPTVTVLNTESADFRIERQFGLSQPVAGSTGGSDNSNFTAVASLIPVDLSVTPNVTRVGNITMDIDIEMNDFDQNLGALTNLAEATGGTPTTITPDAIVTQRTPGVIRKELTTQARIKDGGTVVLGGWRNERVGEYNSGIPILRDIPFVGKYFFDRNQSDSDKITLLIFLTGSVVKD